MRHFIISSLAITLLAGCASNPPQTLPATNKAAGKMMALKRHQSELAAKGMLCGMGIGESADQQMALDMAELNARGELARTLESRTASLQRSFKEQNGQDLVQHGEAVNRSVATALSRGVVLSEVDVEVVDGIYRVYGLAIQRPEVLAKTLEVELSNRKANITRLKASKGYADLQAEIDRAKLEPEGKGDVPPAQ